MDKNAELIESLLARLTDYTKTSLELIKLKVLDKTSDAISSFVPHFMVFVLAASFLFFLNLGLALWLGEILGKTYLGFFVVAGFYFILGTFIHFFLHKRIKNRVCDYIIAYMLT